MSASSQQLSTQEIKRRLFVALRQLEPEFEALTDAQLHRRCFRATTSVRLSYEGFCVLRRHFEHHRFDIERRLTGRELIQLRQQATWPFFLSDRYVYLFCSRDVFVARLKGSIHQWLAP